VSAAVARHVGARHVVITDANPERLALAAGVADVVPVDTSKEDLASVMDQLGMKEARRQARDERCPCCIPARAFQIDWATIVFRMITVKGIYGREMFER
jgi:threonine 3-dehydrogenase